MKNLFLQFLILTIISISVNAQSVKVKNTSTDLIDDSYKSTHLLEDCKDKFGFSRNTANKAWLYTGRKWLFAKSDLTALD